MSQPSDTDGFVSRLCDVIEPVLKKHGIPLYGFPLGEDSADPRTLYAIGEGDRGDVTSDIAEAVLDLFQAAHDALDNVFEPQGFLPDRVVSVAAELRKTRVERNAWSALVSDLDRCEHGRHEGDLCSSCGGPSKGNPLWVVGHGPERVASAPVDATWERLWARFGNSRDWPDRLIGFTISGVPICVPPKPAPGERSPSAESYQQREA